MKVRVEIVDEAGIKTAIESEGDPFSETFRDQAISGMVEFLNSRIPSPHVNNPYGMAGEDRTIKERLMDFLRFDPKKPTDWFTSSELKRTYEEAYGGNLKLSTLSSYLKDLYSDGILTRKGSRAGRLYRMISTTTTTTDRFDLPAHESELPENDDRENDEDMKFIDCFPFHEIIQN